MLYGKVLRSRDPHALDPAPRHAKSACAAGRARGPDGGRHPDTRYGTASRTRRSSRRTACASPARPSRPSPRPRSRRPGRRARDRGRRTKPLPAVFDAEERCWPARRSSIRTGSSTRLSPILVRERQHVRRARIVGGDVEEGFAKSYRIYEHRFTTSKVHPGYTEPRGPSASGTTTARCAVWSNTQLPFDIQEIAGRDARPAARQGAGGRARHRRRLRRQAALGVEHFAALLARQVEAAGEGVTTSEEELTSPIRASRPWSR